MSALRQEVQWSPVRHDEFITWGSEIHLYKTVPREYATGQSIELSHSTSAQLLATNSAYHFVKCIDIYPKEEKDTLLAVGLANGKVVLATFGSPFLDSKGLPVEFVPRHSRLCNILLWNPLEDGLLAAGMDKHRNDCGVVVWDMEASDIQSPVCEIGLSDSASSLSWLRSSTKCIAAGFNNKFIKVFDVKDPAKMVNACQTKAVYGLTACPDNDFQLSSFFECQIAIWDLRKFDKPLVTCQKNKPVWKISWCPTRKNLLGCLLKESSSIHMVDVQTQSDDCEEATILERSVKPGSAHYLTSFSWHPSHHNRLLALSVFGGLLDYSVNERMTLSWGHSTTITWTSDSKTLNMIENKDNFYETFGDVSATIKKRVLNKYGFQHSLKVNAELVSEDNVKKIWHWLEHSQDLVDRGVIDSPVYKHPGVRTVLGLDTDIPVGVDSIAHFLPWSSISSSASAKIYRSEVRDKALELCGWKFALDPNVLIQTVEELVKNGETTKAAAYCVFVQKLKNAIQILSIDGSHSTVAMALAGFTHDKNSMWKESCTNLRSNISDPFLRIIFSFLTSDFETYDSVLMESEVDVSDRIGFALTFLSDTYLIDYIDQLSESLILQGDLAGILLTGVTEKVIPLLQQYINFTSDIQTPCLLCLRALPRDLLEHDIVSYWISCYRDLLDSWMLWEYRAEFDIWLCGRSQVRPPQQVYVTCNFCGKCAANTSSGSGPRNKTLYPRYSASSNQTKVSCCPHCRKPQPRCAICLVHMGTGSVHLGEAVVPSPQSPSNSSPVNPIDSWYTWCQTCRHGGHVSHITSWFREHSECPVTGCTCKCMSLDSVGAMPSLSSIT